MHRATERKSTAVPRSDGARIWALLARTSPTEANRVRAHVGGRASGWAPHAYEYGARPGTGAWAAFPLTQSEV